MIARIACRMSLALALIAGALPGWAQTPPEPPAMVQPTAHPLIAAAAHIQSLLDAGHAAAAAAAARAFARQVTDAAGFGVTNARLTVAPATGYGVFTPRDSAVYAVNEPVFAYVELFGFSMTPQPDGTNALVFDVSFTLETPDGRQMTERMVPMGEILLTSHSEPLDAYFHLTYSITGAEGPFVLRTRVVDRASGNIADFTLPLEFRAATPGAGHPDPEADKRR